MPINPDTRRGFELLRPVFAGIAARHDRVLMRLTVAESDFNEFLSGPNDPEWAQNRCIGFNGLTIREPQPLRVTEQQIEEIRAARPDAQFAHFEGGDEQFYVQPGINSSMKFSGDIPAFAQFKGAAHDAGYFAIKFLHETKVDLNLPELVPLSAVAAVRSVYASTSMPGSLMERWLLFLHILGWQASGHAPLRAERVLWRENLRLAADPEHLMGQLEAFAIEDSFRASITLPPRYFASTLVQDISLASVYAIDTILSGRINAATVETTSFRERLAAIKPGRPQASEYHSLVAEILTVVFEPDLRNPVREEKLHDGRGRIDIVFDNAAEREYFYDIQFRHGIKCPVVFFECKNYSDDIAGAEFAQLASRLSTKRSQVGFIVCRSIDNDQAVLNRCKDHFNEDKGHIIVLTDSDLVALLEAKAASDSQAVSHYLRQKWRPIFMNQ